MQADLEARAYRDPYWNLTIFRNPKVVRREERTGLWAQKKIAALEQEVTALATRPRLRIASLGDDAAECREAALAAAQMIDRRAA